MSAVRPPLVSVVTAAYNVARYLPDLFAAFEAQTLDHGSLELIFVDDGSSDETGRMLEEFADRWDGPARVLSQANAGQSAARNAGIAVATGEWLSFVDADDVIADNFYAALTAAATKHAARGVLAFAAKPLTWNEQSGAIEDKHPLNFRFTRTDRVVDLDSKPNYSHCHMATTIFQRAHIQAEGLRFDERFYIRFEDAHFVGRFLLSAARPLLGLVSSTTYLIRVRSDGSSTVQNARFDPRAYTIVPRLGYLGLLEYAVERLGRVPEWTQNLVLYDLYWLMRSSQTEPLRSARFDDDVHREFRSTLALVLNHLSVETITGFDLMPVPVWMREALWLLKEGEPDFSRPVVGRPDPWRRLLPIRYLHRGQHPDERISVAGRTVEARYSKEQQLEFLGRPLVWKRTLWVSATGIVRLWLNDRLQPLTTKPWVQAASPYKFRMSAISRLSDEARHGAAPERFRQYDGAVRDYWWDRARTWWHHVRERFDSTRLQDAWLSLMIHTPMVRRRFKDAWVFMDRDFDANDSGEVLYNWVAEHHPKVKSYFVLDKDARDWARLKAEGVRLVAYGSWQWKCLMLLAAHLASSHADRYVTEPLPRDRYGDPQWTFTFLQHGVIKGDISRWLNHKEIGVFVTATEDEYDFVSGPGPFKVGPKEVRLTGLPRHDDLLRQDQEVDPSERRYLLIAPTWRDYLTGELEGLTGRHSLLDDFMESRYARAFSDLLSSPELGDLARAAGLEIAFMPHPNIQPYLDRFQLPDHVRVMRYADYDVRWVIARSIAMITDYSSMAFNMAYLQRPTIYFQFDTDEYFGGGHTERPGYFGYDTHGFGPVVETIDGVVAAVAQVVDGDLDPVYLRRMRETFPVRDGGNSQRVYRAMIQARTPLTRRKASVPASPDRWKRG